MSEFSSPYVAPLRAMVTTVMKTDVLQTRGCFCLDSTDGADASERMGESSVILSTEMLQDEQFETVEGLK